MKDWKESLSRLKMCDQNSKGCSVRLGEWLNNDNLEILEGYIISLLSEQRKEVLEEVEKFAWLRAFKGIDYKIRNGWGLESYLYKIVPELKIFIERQLEDEEYSKNNQRRSQIFRRTLRKIEAFEKMTDKESFKNENQATKLFEYIGKHHGWYWN